MEHIQYIGRAHRRVIRDQDMARVGIDNFQTTTWARGESQEVLVAVAKWLTENLPDEFVKVEKPQEPAPLAATSEAPIKPSSSSSEKGKA